MKNIGLQAHTATKGRIDGTLVLALFDLNMLNMAAYNSA
jgi:hypothetical protein